MTHHGRIMGLELPETLNVDFRNDKEVGRGLGMDVLEGDRLVILIHDPAGQFLRRDPAEEAGGHDRGFFLDVAVVRDGLAGLPKRRLSSRAI